MGISYDKFIRTTSPEHKRGVQAMFTLLKERGYIYKGSYTGQYCVFDELYADDNTPGTPCPVCGRITETVQEENYFFKLSAMAEPLLKLYEENPGLIYPETRRNEVIAFVKGGLRDLSISRTTFSWGIPVPDDPAHVIYVWLDALCNYATAVGFGSPDPADQQRYAALLACRRTHDRQRDRALPLRLLAGFPAGRRASACPNRSWLTAGCSLRRARCPSRAAISCAARPFSKSSAPMLCATSSSAKSSSARMASFSFDALVQRFNSDLANGLGNLASRTLSMIGRYFEGEVPYPSATIALTPAEAAIARLAGETIAEYNRLFDAFHSPAPWSASGPCSAPSINTSSKLSPGPSREKEDDRDARSRLATILYTSAEALRIITVLAHPIIPESTAKIFTQLGLSNIAKTDLNTLRWGQLNVGTRLGRIEPVFPRADKSAIERMQQMEEERKSSAETAAAGANGATAATGTPPPPPRSAIATAPASPAPHRPRPAPGRAHITIDDFLKVELRVGTVLTAEKVEKADKLLRLTVDIGTEVRQIVAGIAKAYAPETLVGRKVVIVANLAPRKLRGIESQGMIVAASSEKKASPPSPASSKMSPTVHA